MALTLQKKTELFLEERLPRPLKRNSVCVALSGGIDSQFLLLLLARIARERRFALSAFHVNHRLQPPEDQTAEKTAVRTICDALNVPLASVDLSENAIPGILQSRRCGTEAAARQCRYALFDKHLAQNPGMRIATAHHLDDQIETVVMRLMQGSGNGGLSGIAEQRGAYIRPLLSATRDEIERGFDRIRREERLELRIHTDRSNSDERHLRNRMRHKLIPVVKEIFPGAARALQAYSAKRGIDEQYIEGRLNQMEQDGTDENFLALPPALRLRKIYRIYDQRLPGAEKLPFRFVKPLLFAEKNMTIKGHGIEIGIKKNKIYIKSLVS